MSAKGQSTVRKNPVCSILDNFMKGRCTVCILWDCCSKKEDIGDIYILVSADESIDNLDRLVMLTSEYLQMKLQILLICIGGAYI